MKTIDEQKLQANLPQYIDALEHESIVVTRHGKPCAVLHSAGVDVETAELTHSAEFWTMIEQRRQEPLIPWDEAKRALQ